MKKEKINFKRLASEFISVAFAVLLALLVNQWREHYNNQKLADKAVISIKQELADNIDLAAELIPSHQSILAKIDSLLEISGHEEGDLDVALTLELSVLNSSAWKMAKATNAIYYLNYDVVNTIAKVYGLQEYYESIIKEYITSHALVNSPNSDITTHRNNRQFLKTIIPIEEDLKSYYELMLTEVLSEEK